MVLQSLLEREGIELSPERELVVNLLLGDVEVLYVEEAYITHIRLVMEKGYSVQVSIPTFRTACSSCFTNSSLPPGWS